MCSSDLFEMASTARKRVILSQLYDKVEVGRGYQVTVHLGMSYRQFIELGQPSVLLQGKEDRSEIGVA